MKNIHLLPTEKPSRLVQGKNLYFYKDGIGKNFIDIDEKFQNIYITSSEEIKEGDWFLWEGFSGEWILQKCECLIYNLQKTNHLNCNFKVQFKVILSTDPDLIKDGVQAIDDEFLEWFVKNLSCERVEVIKDRVFRLDEFNQREFYDNYKIIIPQEELKQEFCDNCGNDVCCCIIRTQETLEEVGKFAEIRYLERLDNFQKCDFKDGVIEGAKYQAEIMYSDIELFTEELKDKIDSFEYSVNQNSYISDYVKEWFEQFKKK
jgi:hypothetical protein